MENKLTGRSLAIVAGLMCLMTLGGCGSSYQQPEVMLDARPEIYPDYAGVVMPVNIAPLNFLVKEEGEEFQLAVVLDGERRMVLCNTDGKMQMPESDWKELLADAAGKEIAFQVAVKRNGKWEGYQEILNTVSPDAIESSLL